MTPPTFEHLACVYADTAHAREGFELLTEANDFVPADRADAIVALGGDGFMLETLRAHLGRDVAVYGMNRGSVGFLMNTFAVEDLARRVNVATRHRLFPLRLDARCTDGVECSELAVNEVSMIRESVQAAHLAVSVNGIERLERLVCDGLMVATPAGSTAYNLSAHGPVIPLDAALLALTPISPFRPRRWRGALLPRDAEVHIRVLDPDKRPVGAGADAVEVRSITEARIIVASDLELTVLFDSDHSLDERIIAEQFS